MLTDKLRAAVFESISHARLAFLDIFAQRNSEHLNYLLQQGVIDAPLIDEALERSVLKQAKIDYEYLSGIRAREGSVEAIHHCTSEYLAYAMSKPNFDTEFGPVNFEDAKSKEEFCGKYGRPQLIAYLRQQILNPPAPSTFNDRTLMCSDGPCTC
jgi:hypothetical protein